MVSNPNKKLLLFQPNQKVSDNKLKRAKSLNYHDANDKLSTNDIDLIKFKINEECKIK